MRTILVSLLMFVLSVSSVNATNPLPCGNYDIITHNLKEKYNETKKHERRMNRGMVEFFVSEEGTWTALLIESYKWACIMSTGKNWKKFKRELEGQET